MRFLFELCEMILLVIFSIYAIAALAKVGNTHYDSNMIFLVVLSIFGRGYSKIIINERMGDK